MAEAQKVAVAGLGSVGMRVARAIDAGRPGLELAAVCASDTARARQRVDGFRRRPAVVPVGELARHAAIVVECLPPEHFRLVAEPVVRKRGTILIVASVGALLFHDDIVAEAAENGIRILAPSGAVAGLDGLRAARAAGLESVALVTRKPPRSIGPLIETAAGRVSADSLDEAVQIFSGSAREAVAAFPKNVNVAATVSLAGIGPDATRVEIWADPAVETNCHALTVRSRAGSITARSDNLPDPENPRSSAVTGYSILAMLDRLVEPVSIGS